MGMGNLQEVWRTSTERLIQRPTSESANYCHVRLITFGVGGFLFVRYERKVFQGHGAEFRGELV